MRPHLSIEWSFSPSHRENQVLEAASRSLASQGGGCGITFFRNCACQPHKTFPKRMELPRQQHYFRKGFVRLIGANSETKKPSASLLGLQTVLMVAASALWFSLWSFRPNDSCVRYGMDIRISFSLALSHQKHASSYHWLSIFCKQMLQSWFCSFAKKTWNIALETMDFWCMILLMFGHDLIWFLESYLWGTTTY